MTAAYNPAVTEADKAWAKRTATEAETRRQVAAAALDEHRGVRLG